VHNNFCNTNGIHCDPKGTKVVPIKFDRTPILDLNSKKKEEEVVEHPAAADESESVEEETEDEIVEDEEVSLDDNDDSVDKVNDLMHDSFNSFGLRKVEHDPISPREGFTKEEIDLRHAETIKNEYYWLTPDWVGTPLRSTPRGTLLKTKGDLASPVTDTHSIMLEKGDIVGWEKPEWTNAKLRATPNGKILTTPNGTEIKNQVQEDGKMEAAPTL